MQAAEGRTCAEDRRADAMKMKDLKRGQRWSAGWPRDPDLSGRAGIRETPSSRLGDDETQATTSFRTIRSSRRSSRLIPSGSIQSQSYLHSSTANLPGTMGIVTYHILRSPRTCGEHANLLWHCRNSNDDLVDRVAKQYPVSSCAPTAFWTQHSGIGKDLVIWG